MAIDVEELHRSLEEAGEENVRRLLAQGVYGEQKKPSVEEWLLGQERERAAQETVNRDALSVQNTQKLADAAREAAKDQSSEISKAIRDASQANWTSKASLLVAAISMCIAGAALYVTYITHPI